MAAFTQRVRSSGYRPWGKKGTVVPMPLASESPEGLMKNKASLLNWFFGCNALKSSFLTSFLDNSDMHENHSLRVS